MMSLSRMIPLGLIVVGLCTSGCSTWPAPFGDQSRSARTDDGASLDAPKADGAGARNNDKLAHKRGAKPGDAMHFYTNQRIAMVARPARYSASELARVEVWWTDNNGFHWRKAGHFEQGQAFFPLNVKEDGDYGIRFVGPGEEPAQRVLATPERTYHVDTVQPEVQVLVDPEQADYHVGDLVSIDWMVQDFQLEKHPVTIEVLFDRGDADTGPTEFQRDLPDEGSVTYRIPPEALGREISFRVEARDRTGNLGLAYTRAFRTVEDPMAAELAKAEIDESEIDPTDRVAVATPDPKKESDTTAPLVKEEKEEAGEPALAVGPILVLVEDSAEEADAAAAIASTPIVAANISDNTAAKEQRATNEAKRAKLTRLSVELKSHATMLTSRVVEAMDSVVDGWVAAAKIASAKDRKTTQSPAPVTVAVVEAPVAEVKQSARIENEAATQTPASVAVAAIETDDVAVSDTADAEKLDQGQAARTPPTFAVVEQPIDKSTANVAVQKPLIATAAQIEAEETDTRPAGSTFLEVGPQIVMAEEPFEENPTAGLAPSDKSTAVAISDAGEADQLDSSPDAPQTNERRPDASLLAASDEDITDKAGAPQPDCITQRSSDLPFATAIARLPAIGPRMMNDDSTPKDVPTDGTTTHSLDATELPDPAPEENTHPQVSALASAEQETKVDERTGDTRLVAENLPDNTQPADATMAEGTGDENDEQNQDSATAKIVASMEQSEEEEPFLPATSIESLTAVDPTQGNGLLVPLPATLEEDDAPPLRVTAHPWRILGRQPDSMEKTVWTLPERRSDVRWRPVFTGRFLADDPTLRDVAEPGNAALPTLAGTTEEVIEGNASDEP